MRMHETRHMSHQHLIIKRSVTMAENKYLTIDKDSFPYVFIRNIDILLKTYEKGLLRANVFLPKDAAPFGDKTYPVIATYGPCTLDPHQTLCAPFLIANMMQKTEKMFPMRYSTRKAGNS